MSKREKDNMDETQGSTLITKQVANECFTPSEQVLAFLDDRIAQHRHLLECQHELQERLRPTREERAIRARLRERMIAKLGARARADISRLRELAEERSSMLQNFALSNPVLSLTPILSPLGNPPVLSDVNRDPWMWWARTTFFYQPHEASMWYAEDGVHIAALFQTESGDLQKRGLRVVAQYELGAERMPEGNRHYLSAPVAEVLGTARGYASESGIFDFGDEWAKLWLNTKQTVFVLPKLGEAGIAVAVGQVSVESRRLIFIEGGGVESAVMPGLIGMPPIRFFLPPDTFSIIVELEWSFDVQLENRSFIYIGHSQAAPSCVLKHPQWPLLAT
jgi:hypothetical protein